MRLLREYLDAMDIEGRVKLDTSLARVKFYIRKRWAGYVEVALIELIHMSNIELG